MWERCSSARESIWNPSFSVGGPEHGLRSGTENVAGLVGMGTAAERAGTDMETQRERRTDRRQEFVRTLQETTDAKLIGHPENRLPGYAMLCFPGQNGAALIDALAAADVAVSCGLRCRGIDLRM